MHKTTITQDGRFIGTFICTGKRASRKSLRTIINNRKRATRDARLVKMF